MDPHSIEVAFTWSYDMPQRGDLSPVPPPKPPDVTINGRMGTRVERVGFAWERGEVCEKSGNGSEP